MKNLSSLSQTGASADLSFYFEIPVFSNPCFLSPGSLNSSHERSRLAFAVSVSDLRSVTVREEGWTFIVLQLKDSSTSLPHLHFHQGGSRAFLDSLRRFALLTE